MDVNSLPQQLYWDSSYEIVLQLMESYPDVELDAVGLDQLYGWIIGFPNFRDDPEMVNEGILQAILREWYEEASAR
jgi:FeS assembly protein IscX